MFRRAFSVTASSSAFHLNSPSLSSPKYPDIQQLAQCLTPGRKTLFESIISTRMHGLCLVLEDVLDVGNRSAVFRTAEAYNLESVHVITTEGKYKKSSRTVSRGSEKWLNIQHYKQSTDAVNKLKSQGFRLLATDLNTDVTIEQLKFDVPTAIVLGNEHAGVSKEMLSLCDGAFRLPMYGFTESLNISVAAAIIIHHARLNREALLGIKGDLSPEMQQMALETMIKVEFGLPRN